MNVIIAGSRCFTDYDVLRDALHNLSWFIRIDTVLSGLAHGPDTLALQWAANNDISVEKYPADWDKYGKAAGPMRNQQMVEEADALICFWDGESRGTKSMIDLALGKGLVVIVIPVEATEV